MTPLTANRMTLDIARQTQLARDIARTQTSIATGRRLQQPSDDAGASARITALRRVESDMAASSAILDLGKALAAQADSAARAMSGLLSEARVHMLVDDTASAADRATHAAALDGIAEELAALVDSESAGGGALFATGPALGFRFDASNLFAPVPSRAVFEAGGVSLADLVRAGATALRADDSAAIDASRDALDAAISRTADAAADIGIRAARMDRLGEAAAARALEVAAERSALADTDLAEAIATLNQQQLTLDAAQAAFARINRRTLFDILS